MKHKILFTIILIVLLIVIAAFASYFGFKLYKQKNISITPIQPQITNYEPQQNPEYWPKDLFISSEFIPQQTKQTKYSEDLIISSKTLESPYPLLPTFNYFKDYLNNNLWEITKEETSTEKYYLAARREGYITFTILPNYNGTSNSYVKIEYQINPKKPLSPKPKEIAGSLPTILETTYKYLIYKNSKIGGYSKTINGYIAILSTTDSSKSVYDYYLKTLKDNKWDITFNTSTENFFSISAKNNLNSLEIILEKSTPKQSVINISIK